MLKKRISTPRAATVVVLAAVVAVSVAVVPAVAQSFLTSQKASRLFLSNQKAAKTYVSNKKASTLYLRKKAASNLYVAKATAPLSPVGAIAAGTAQFGPVSATTAGYIPTAFTSFATKATVSNVVISFSGTATCTTSSKEATADQACPVQILVDGQSTGKVNFAPATLSPAKGAAPLVHTIVQTTVLGKGGHTVAIQYAGAANVAFTLKSWNLAVQAYPQPEEAPPTAAASPTK
ncbi:MAG: hypothetical protein JST31_11415 [Actinobacteria bacterium]|nr:hypothetical protein [Actinomycetota bacterium]